MFVLPQIAYGNTALIFPSHFQGYNKNEIFADYWDAYMPFTIILNTQEAAIFFC
jgi:hypothetical protein